ncbi:hypothetical protein [Paenibacillus sinopodophylli]|uniref:hypothetical protein n=1 Tax=Paenibacillus sinopodophylli TaxID=1837342 RepID=UPI00110CA1B5|nr:hypothetical protein [Paenibacillus sinopodophylli]
MNFNLRNSTNAALLAPATALIIVLAGCQNAAPPEPTATETSMISIHSEQNDSPQKTYSEAADNEPNTDEPKLSAVDTSTDSSAETSTVRPEKDSKASVKTESEDAEWQADKPLLKGIAIGTHDSTVTKLFGNPVDSYKLDEESEPITVLEYEGFAIGINPYQSVQFIEVFGTSIAAGLSGLQIGDNPERALRALGKPSKQTAYLLTYEAKNSLLKLDIDPVHNEIVSIKLLALS